MAVARDTTTTRRLASKSVWPKPPVRGEDASEKARKSGADSSSQKRRKLSAPVRGEDAADKARAGSVLAALETKRRYQDVVKSAQDTMAKTAANDPISGRNDYGRGALASPKPPPSRTKAELKGGQGPGTIGRVVEMLVEKPLEDAVWAIENPLDRVRGRGRAANGQMMWPGGGRVPKLKLGMRKPEPILILTAPAAGRPPVSPTRTGGAAPTPTSPAEQIIGALPGARTQRRQQEVLYSAERSKRAAQAEQAMQVGGREGHLAALRQLKGELPKIKFGALENFDQAAVDGLFSHVQQHGQLRTFEKIRTQTALQKVLEGGQVPTRSEIKLLERAFGPEVAAQIAESVPFWTRAKDLGYSLINVPRSLRASYDISAPFRQGLVLGARHPRMFSREFVPMVRSLLSEGAYQDIMDDIASRPTFPTMQKAKLQLTDLEGISTREEGFMSNLAEKIPVIGRGVRSSGRAYTAFLNKFRADAFDNYLTMAEAQGLDIDDPALLKSIARWVNHATGRGSVKSLEGAMVPLNALLFSPRLIASRLQLLNPAFYATLDPFARKQAVQGMTQLLGAISLTLYMADLAGAEVGLDPRSSDFAKIKVGDTRVDIAGGFQQYIVAATRFVKGETVSSTTGEVTKLEGGFAKLSRADIAWNFVENKLAPVPTWGVDFAKNENFAGDEFDPLKEGARALTPLGLENAYEGFKVGGRGAGITSLGLGSIGFGVQTYKPKAGSSARPSKSLWGKRGTRKSKSLWPGSGG
jgi:hypothetical protein